MSVKSVFPSVLLELDDHPDPERLKKALSVTKTNTKRMIRLVGDLIRLSTGDTYETDEEMSVRSLFLDIPEELWETV